MNVYYDILIERSATKTGDYTWEQFIVELQTTVPFYINVFLAPDMQARPDESAPGYDPHEAALTGEVCRRCKEFLSEWSAFEDMEGMLKAMVDRKAAHHKGGASKVGRLRTRQWTKEACDRWVSDKWCAQLVAHQSSPNPAPPLLPQIIRAKNTHRPPTALVRLKCRAVVASYSMLESEWPPSFTPQAHGPRPRALHSLLAEEAGGNQHRRTAGPARGIATNCSKGRVTTIYSQA